MKSKYLNKNPLKKSPFIIRSFRPKHYLLNTCPKMISCQLDKIVRRRNIKLITNQRCRPAKEMEVSQVSGLLDPFRIIQIHRA